MKFICNYVKLASIVANSQEMKFCFNFKSPYFRRVMKSLFSCWGDYRGIFRFTQEGQRPLSSPEVSHPSPQRVLPKCVCLSLSPHVVRSFFSWAPIRFLSFIIASVPSFLSLLFTDLILLWEKWAQCWLWVLIWCPFSMALPLKTDFSEQEPSEEQRGVSVIK